MTAVFRVVCKNCINNKHDKCKSGRNEVCTCKEHNHTGMARTERK